MIKELINKRIDEHIKEYGELYTAEDIKKLRPVWYAQINITLKEKGLIK